MVPHRINNYIMVQYTFSLLRQALLLGLQLRIAHLLGSLGRWISLSSRIARGKHAERCGKHRKTKGFRRNMIYTLADFLIFHIYVNIYTMDSMKKKQSNC